MRKGPAIWFLTILFVFSMVPAPVRAALPPLWDVIGTDYEESVKRLSAIGVVAGNPDGTFAPKGLVTRAQMAAFALRALGDRNAATFATPFTDVPETHWAHSVIYRAAQVGLIRGDGTGTFRPDDSVTYSEAMAILIRALGYENEVEGSFPVGHVLKAKELGLIGSQQSFGLSEPITRGDLALSLDVAIHQVPLRFSGVTLSQSVHRKADSIVITPSQDLVSSEPIQLRAEVVDVAGNSLPGETITWTLSSGQADLSQGGLLTISGGSATVRAAAGLLSVEKTFKTITGLRIDGLPATVLPGSSSTLSAKAKDPSGADVSVPVSWAIVSGPATISKAGALTISGSGEVKVSATFGKTVVSASTVSGAGLEIGPVPGPLAKGEKYNLEAFLGGVKVDSVTWSLVEGDGTLLPSGALTAGTRPAKVRAKLGTLTADAVIDVFTLLKVSAVQLTVTKSETAELTATAISASGQEIKVPASWSLSGGVGLIDANGKMIATAAGTGTVTATYRGLTISVPVTVIGDPTLIKLETDKTSVVSNGKSVTKVTARVVDQRGNTVTSAQGKAAFTLSNALGTLSSSEAVFQNGVASVTFTAGLQSGTTRITVGGVGLPIPGGFVDLVLVAPALNRIALSVSPSAIAAQAASRATLSVTLVDQDGVAFSNNTSNYVTVYLSITGPGTLNQQQLSVSPAQSTVSTYVESKGQPGTITVTGSSNFTVSPTTLTTVITGPAAKLAIRSVTPVKADNVTEAFVDVELQDASGAVRTQDGGLAVTLTGQIGDYVPSSVPQQQIIQNGVARFRIRSPRAGEMKLTARASNLQQGDGTATFTPGSAYKVRLSTEPSDPTSTTLALVAADGGLTTVKLKAEVLDQFDNLVTSATNAVSFFRQAYGGATAQPSVLTVNASGGVAELSLPTTTNVGTDTYKATAVGLIDSGTVTISTRVTGVPTRVEVQAIPTVNAGTETTVRVRVLDSQGYQVTGLSGATVTLSSNSATFVSGGAQTLTQGLAIFKVKETRAGVWSLTAQATNVGNPSTAVNWQVLPGLASKVTLKATPDALPADGSVRATVSAEMVDDFGNTVSTYAVVTMTANGGTLNSTLLTTGGSVLLTPTAGATTITITGTASTGVSVEPVTVRAYTPGVPTRAVIEAPSEISVGTQYQSPATIRVRVLDSNGNVATQVNTDSISTSQAGILIEGLGGSNTAVITNAGGTGLVNYGFTPDGIRRGAASITYGTSTFTYSNTRAERVTMTPVVYYQGRQLDASPIVITTKPGTPVAMVIDGGGNVLQADGQSSLTLSAKVVDAFGNAVATVGDTFKLTLDPANFLSLSGPAEVGTEIGQAAFTVNSLSGSGGTTTVRVTSLKTGLTAVASIATDLLPAQPTAWAYAAVGGGTIISSSSGGAYIQVTTQARSSIQTVYVYVNGVRVNIYFQQSGDTQISTIAPGGTLFGGYIRYADLGGLGTKEVRVVLTSPLGASPFSQSTTLTVTN